MKVSGVTIHFVNEKLDAGPIIIQEAFKLSEEETIETLEQKIHKMEHRVYPKAVALFAEGRISVKGRKVKILKPQNPK